MIRYEAVITALIGAILGTVLGRGVRRLVSRPLADEGFVLSYPVERCSRSSCWPPWRA